MSKDIKDVMRVLALYPDDLSGAVIALRRIGAADALRRVARVQREYAAVGPACDRASAVAIAQQLTGIADSMTTQLRYRAADLHEIAVSPRLSATGRPRAVYVDPVSETARSSAGAVQRFGTPQCLTPEQRGRLYSRMRAEGAELPYRQERRKKRKNIKRLAARLS